MLQWFYVVHVHIVDEPSQD